MNSEKKQRIMVVDDEPDLREILKFNLQMEGFDVDVAASAEEAIDMLRQPMPDNRTVHSDVDLLLLDVMMAGMSGFALAQQLKTDDATRHLPIIFLTARDTENDIITGLNLGADDYISKPFSLRELIARVHAVLRRAQHHEVPVLQADGIIIDEARKIATVDDNDAQLTRTEFDLLRVLITERGQVFSRAELIARVWPPEVVVTERTVDVCVTRLRKKLGNKAAHIVSKSGFGYAFVE